MAIYKRGPIYWIDYYTRGNQRVREAVGPNKKEAKAVLAKRVQEVFEGKYGIHKGTAPTITEAVKLFLETRINKRAYRREQICLEHFVEHFKDKKLSDITATDINVFRDKRAGVVKPGTVNRELTALKTFLFFCVEKKFIMVNPAAGKKRLLHVEQSKIRVVSFEELDRILDCCPADIKPVVAIAFFTGLRRGELLQLTWSNVDMEGRKIHVAAETCKTLRSRDVPMNQVVQETLLSMLGTSGKVFNVSVDRLDAAFRKAVRQAHVHGVSFHTLRHSFASHVLSHGASIREVQDLLGHATINQTMRYTHPSEQGKNEAVERLTGHTVVTNSRIIA